MEDSSFVDVLKAAGTLPVHRLSTTDDAQNMSEKKWSLCTSASKKTLLSRTSWMQERNDCSHHNATFMFAKWWCRGTMLKIAVLGLRTWEINRDWWARKKKMGVKGNIARRKRERVTKKNEVEHEGIVYHDKGLEEADWQIQSLVAIRLMCCVGAAA